MSFLLDTNVVSEWVRPRPNAGVATWLAEVDEELVFLSVVTLAELRHGIARLPDGSRRVRLDDWLSAELPARFARRILAIESDVALAWGDVVTERHKAGRPIGAMDAFIAATARVRDLQVVTRNTSDFEGSVRGTLNPWNERGRT
jgi:predicted nucleic acid-binding protein